MYGQLEQVKYINHLGEELHFGRDGLYVNENDLHDFTWTATLVNDRLTGFERGMQTRTIPVRIACASQTEGIIRRNRLFQIPEKDVLGMQYGRIVINGYYCECFVTASKKSRYSISGKYMETDLTITTDRPYWVRERKLSLETDPSWKPESASGLDFPFDFPFDFSAYTDRRVPIVNESAFSTNFRMEIYGYTTSPTIKINNHEYSVTVTVPAEQKLVINSAIKKIYLCDLDGGNQENSFDKRNRDSYIFEPIPSGELNVLWDNKFDVDIYLLEQLSEPKWVLGDIDE